MHRRVIVRDGGKGRQETRKNNFRSRASFPISSAWNSLHAPSANFFPLDSVDHRAKTLKNGPWGGGEWFAVLPVCRVSDLDACLPVCLSASSRLNII